MNIFRILISFLLFVCCMNITFASDIQVTDGKEQNMTNMTDLNRPILVEKSKPVFTVRLASNKTTGYSWFLQTPLPPNIVPFRYFYQKPVKNLPGAPGFEEWEFRILAPGFTVPQAMEITLNYVRPWELEEAKRVVIKIYTH